MKTPTASTIGLPGGLWTIGLAGLLVLLPLAILAPLAGAFGFAALASLGTVFTAIVLHRRATGAAAAQEKLSGEIGLLSRRLLKVEAAAGGALAGLARLEAAGTAVAADDTGLLAAGIEEVTAEIGLLSGIVRELAAVVAAQEGEIARLRAEPAPKPPAFDATAVAGEQGAEPRRPLPKPVPVPPREGAAAPAVPATTPRSVPRLIPDAAGRSPLGIGPAAAHGDAEPVPPTAPPSRNPEEEGACVEAFDGEGLEVWLQPVVTLPQRKVVSYEALARLRLGTEVLTPETFLPVLERHGRTTALDRRMLRSAATIARHLQRRGSAAVVAYALSPLSLFEPDFLRSLAGLVAGEADLAGRVVITLPQASWRSLDPEQNAVLTALHGRIGFGLDRPTDLRFDTRQLAERGVSQIKVPASLLLHPPAHGSQPDIAVDDLVAALARVGIRLVATEVEREAEVPDLIDLDLPLAQGTIFASPKAVRAEVLTEVAAPAVPVVAEASPSLTPEPPPQRRAFRDFLRRAV